MPEQTQYLAAISTSPHIKLPSSRTMFFLPLLRACGLIKPSYLADIECPSLLYIVDWERALITSSKSTHEEEGPLLRKRMDALRVAELRRYKDKSTAHEYVVAFMTHPELGKRYLRIERVIKPTAEENAGRVGEDYPSGSTPSPTIIVGTSSHSMGPVTKDRKGTIVSISINDKPAMSTKSTEKPALCGLFGEPIDLSTKRNQARSSRPAGGKAITTTSPQGVTPARVPSPNEAFSKVQPGAKSMPLPRRNAEMAAIPPFAGRKEPPASDVSTLFNWPNDILIETLGFNRSKIQLREVAIVASLVHTNDDPYKYLKNSSSWFSDYIIQLLSHAFNQRIVRETNDVDERENPDWTAEELSPNGTFENVPIFSRRKDHIQFLVTAFEARMAQISQQMKDADVVVANKRSQEHKSQETKLQAVLETTRIEETMPKAQTNTTRSDAEESRLHDTAAKLDAITPRPNGTTVKADAAVPRLKRVE